ncbi:MAG: hypothetical protein ACI84R_000821 [Candidatus Azotimanducaceae bacterium]|jgi:hypothetical protein
MIFKFRVCPDCDADDTAQGWVIAFSEIQARVLIGPDAYFQRMPTITSLDAPNGTVFLTQGKLAFKLVP